MRKLASIQQITDLQPIAGADRIEVASVLGWKVVVRKGEFKIGDHCVYCEIDSVMPDKPEFDFLRERKFRIKTAKLRGQISQGICFPLSILSTAAEIQKDVLAVGTDVTERLAVTKYEPPLPIALDGEVKGDFPWYVPKTDELRIQSEPGLLHEIKGKICYITTKIDGTSGTFAHCDGEFDICSRNLSLKEDEKNVYWRVYRKYDIESILKKVGNFAIQGEVAGPGIQKNRLGLKELSLFIFNVYDIDNRQHLDYSDLMTFCVDHGLQAVPVIDDAVRFDFTIEQLLEMARGKYEGTDNHIEGIVIRPLKCVHSEILGGRLSFKVINNDALLRKGNV